MHVVDSGPRGLLPIGPGPRRGPWPRLHEPSVQHRITDAEDEGATALLDTWRERFAGEFPAASISVAVRRGQPEHEIVAEATAFSSRRRGPVPPSSVGPQGPGPRSVGHVARFVVDHAPVPVLLVRRRA